MHLTGLELTNFRSYRSLEVEFPKGLTVAHGGNGAGKSNLLEAAYLLAIGKSYRAPTERDLVAWEAAEAGGYAIVAGTVARAEGQVELRVGLDCQGSSSTAVKRVRINGVAKRAIDLVGALNAVLFTAEDIDLVLGSPGGRRRYLDIMLSQLGNRYLQALQRYQRVLTQRNALLRMLREGRARDDELAYWDDLLCKEGATILAARYDAVGQLAPLIGEAFERLEAQDTLDLTFASTVPFDDRPTPRTMGEALAANRSAERGAGMTLVGPHRDDLRITMNGVDMNKHASRGQARLAALSMRLAEATLLEQQRHDPPVILLDDVLSELDDRRRHLVLEEIAKHQQAILTTADIAQVPSAFLDGARCLRIEAGGVAEEAAV